MMGMERRLTGGCGRWSGGTLGVGAQELGVWYLHDNQVEMERLSLKVSFRWVLDNLAQW